MQRRSRMREQANGTQSRKPSGPGPHAHGHRPRSVAVRKSFRQLVRRRRSAQRRGVILLVTLVLLTLFTMMLITFVVATVTSRQSIEPAAGWKQTGDAPDAIMHDVFLQLIRGPRNPNLADRRPQHSGRHARLGLDGAEYPNGYERGSGDDDTGTLPTPILQNQLDIQRTDESLSPPDATTTAAGPLRRPHDHAAQRGERWRDGADHRLRL